MIENALQFVGKLSPEYIRDSLSVEWTGPEIERLAPMVVKEEFEGGFKALRWNCKQIHMYPSFVEKFLSQFHEITLFDS